MRVGILKPTTAWITKPWHPALFDKLVARRHNRRSMSNSPAPEKSWQARISEATDAIAQTFVESMTYDWRLYRQDIAGSICHAHMLSTIDLITEAERETIIGAL